MYSERVYTEKVLETQGMGKICTLREEMLHSNQEAPGYLGCIFTWVEVDNHQGFLILISLSVQ